MPRKLRVEYPGAIYHLINRGDRREDIFRDDDDRKMRNPSDLHRTHRWRRRGRNQTDLEQEQTEETKRNWESEKSCLR
jgi:hypothetical protein